MYKFKAGSKAHTTWESSFNPYDDHNYKFARDSRGTGLNGYFLPHGYFEYKGERESTTTKVCVAIVLILAMLATMLLT